MGATDFRTNPISAATPEAAFTAACSDARYEYGHGGYTGTIAEKHSFKMFPTAHSIEEAYATIECYLDVEGGDDDGTVRDKWGPAGCIPVPSKTKPNERLFIFFGIASS